MKKLIFNNNSSIQIGFGFTAAALILSYCVCVCAVTGQGLIGVLLCSVVCAFSSLKLKNGIFSPDVFLLVPVVYLLSSASVISAFLSLTAGAFTAFGIKRIIKISKIPVCVIASAALSLSIGVTIILTNYYFGIGAGGGTPFEMLKFFRYLGFHPNFRGLLYGTITLFTMITYPFKFRKLNKYLPAQFITILIPFILNLFLNPQKELTTINEANLEPIIQSLHNFSSFTANFSKNEIPLIIKNALVYALILTGYSTTAEAPDDKHLFWTNTFSGIVTGIPLKKHYIRGYGKTACITAILLITASLIFCPSLFSRLPMHCAGAMLIVNAWQSVPYKTIAEVFKSRRLINILIFSLGIPLYILFEPFTATIIYFIFTLFYNKINTLSKRKECI